MEPQRTEHAAWRFLKRFLFRVLFVYVVVYCFPFPLDIIPVWGEILTEPYTELWHEAVPWVGDKVLGSRSTSGPRAAATPRTTTSSFTATWFWRS
jgi:hypothetical protein